MENNNKLTPFNTRLPDFVSNAFHDVCYFSKKSKQNAWTEIAVLGMMAFIDKHLDDKGNYFDEKTTDTGRKTFFDKSKQREIKHSLIKHSKFLDKTTPDFKVKAKNFLKSSFDDAFFPEKCRKRFINKTSPDNKFFNMLLMVVIILANERNSNITIEIIEDAITKITNFKEL